MVTIIYPVYLLRVTLVCTFWEHQSFTQDVKSTSRKITEGVYQKHILAWAKCALSNRKLTVKPLSSSRLFV